MKSFTKRLYVGIVIAFIISIICSFLFIKSGIDLKIDCYNESSIYSNSMCNFIIPSPSEDQIEELQNKEFIKHVEPYYYTQSTIKFNNKDIISNIIMVDDIESLNYSPYSAQRLVDGKANIKTTAILDFAYAKANNIGVGDVVKVQLGSNIFEHEVSAVYETNTMYSDGVVVINWSSEQKEQVFNSSFQKANYSGAWVVDSNYSDCARYLLNDYKPLGRFKDRSEFETDEAYQSHLDAFNNASFAAEIVDFTVSETMVLSKYNGNDIKAIIYFVFAVIIPLLVCSIFTFSAYTKKTKQLIKKSVSINNINRSKILKRNNICILLFGLVNIIVYIIFAVLYKLIIETYLKFELIKISLLLVCLSVLIGSILLIVCNTVKYNKTFKMVTSKENEGSFNIF